MNEDEVETLQLLHPQDAAGAHRALQYVLRHLTANAKLLRHIGPILEQQHLEEYKRTFLTKVATKVVQDSHLLYSHFLHIRSQFLDILTSRSSG